MADQLSDADKERLCRALEFEPGAEVIGPAGKRYTAPFCPSIEALREAMKTGFEAREIWPPIDSDPAWAVRAMEAAAERGVFYRAEPLAANVWDVWPRRGGRVSVGPFPLAICRALLAALKAGELGRSKGYFSCEGCGRRRGQIHKTECPAGYTGEVGDEADWREGPTIPETLHTTKERET